MKALLRKIVSYLVRCLASILEDELAAHQERQRNQKHVRLKDRLQSCGTGVQFNGEVAISEPRCCVIGNNVHIGSNAHIESEGGLTIGDNSHLCRNLTICTENHDYRETYKLHEDGVVHKPVAIGRNVWIGPNVSLIPGVRIGDGAVIGMGSVVTNDIPSGATVGATPALVRCGRAEKQYPQREGLGRYGDVNSHVSECVPPAPWPHAGEMVDKLFFVLTTGRSGSQSIARTLNLHRLIYCRHEPRPQLIRLSTEYAHKKKSEKEVRQELSDIFLSATTYNPALIHGESDQKYFNLVPLLHQLIPTAKFLWLIRDGRDVVASTTARGWFSNDEYDPNATDNDAKTWKKYRLDGGLCGAIPAKEWSQMTPFARNCWYWNYVNNTIETGLRRIPKSQWMMFTLDDFNRDPSAVLKFLSLPGEPLAVRHENRARPGEAPSTWASWSTEEKRTFQHFCGDGMNKWISPN